MRWWMFEAAIWFFLIIVGAALIEILVTKGKKIFRKKLLLLVATFLVLAWGVVFYGSYIEPKILIVKNESFDLVGLNEPLRVVLLSDIHIGPYKGAGWVEEIVKKTNEQKPDLVLLLGDFVMGQEGKTEQLAALGKFESKYGTFAILGNHDYDAGRSEEVKKALESFGIKVLVNTSTPIKLSDDSVLWLAGAGDLWNDIDLEKTLSGRTTAENVLLMSHNPDVVLSSENDVADLIVSGHTHGGQIRLPWLGPVSNVPTELGKGFDEGWFEQTTLSDFSIPDSFVDDDYVVKTIPFFITSGLGEMGPRARLFNPPEIVMLELE
ncbi:MAG: metallophosphoesterase [Candidatus Uhrbacteria bacterium]